MSLWDRFQIGDGRLQPLCFYLQIQGHTSKIHQIKMVRHQFSYYHGLREKVTYSIHAATPSTGFRSRKKGNEISDWRSKEKLLLQL